MTALLARTSAVPRGRGTWRSDEGRVGLGQALGLHHRAGQAQLTMDGTDHVRPALQLRGGAQVRCGPEQGLLVKPVAVLFGEAVVVEPSPLLQGRQELAAQPLGAAREIR